MSYIRKTYTWKGRGRTARCFQGPYPAFAVAVAKARGNPRPPDRPIQFDGYHDCQDGPYCTHGLEQDAIQCEMRTADWKEVARNLEFALRGLYDDQVDYLTLNNLGGLDNHWMRATRIALVGYEDATASETKGEQDA